MGRWRTVGRTWRTVVVLGAALACLGGPTIRVASAQNADKAEPWHAVVTAERLNIHSGRAEQFEKIGALKQGDVVLVKSVNTFGWAAIAPPPGLSGFVARQDVADGEQPGTVRAIGRTAVLYPISEDPAQCFRKSRVDADTVMKVISAAPAVVDAGFLKVEMPGQVDVYVLAQFLRKATEEEVTAWKEKLADAKAQQPTKAAPTSGETTPAKPAEPENRSQEQPAAQPANEPAAQPEAGGDESPAAEKPDDTIHWGEPELVDENDDAAGAADAAGGDEEQPVDAAPAEPEPIAVTLPNLEQLYTEMTTKPILEAEIEPLLKAYESFATTTEKKGEQRVAEIRAELLKIRLDQQAAMRKLKEAARTANEPAFTPTVEIWRDERGRPVFTAQGKLTSSNVFDGRRLPLLYRLQDEITGRTVAYLSVKPEDRLEVERLLNLDVGVVGEKVRDPGLRIEVVNLQRIVSTEGEKQP